MPIYEYTALKDNKNVIKGKVEADDARQAREKVIKMGLLPTRIDDTADPKSKGRRGKKVAMAAIPSLSLKDKIEFTTSLQILSATGIPIIETLVFIENNAESKAVRKASFEIRKQVIGGSTLAETLAKYREVFGRVYVGLVSAGEDSGELDKTLERMLALLKKQDEIKSKITGALVYPIFVVILAVLIVIVMLVFVFPAFKDMFDGLGKELPMITQICMSAGEFMKKYWYLVLAGFVAIPIGIVQLFKIEVTKRIIDRIVLKVPLLDDMMKFSNFSNFLSVMQVAYDAGIPIVDCLYLANLTMENFVLRDAIMQATSKVQQGTHLSVALRSTEIVPQMILFMIATGEQTGRLGDLLEHCITFIDKKLDDIIDNFTKLIEPVMLVFVGGLVLILALALYLPLFGMYTN